MCSWEPPAACISRETPAGFSPPSPLCSLSDEVALVLGSSYAFAPLHLPLFCPPVTPPAWAGLKLCSFCRWSAIYSNA